MGRIDELKLQDLWARDPAQHYLWIAATIFVSEGLKKPYHWELMLPHVRIAGHELSFKGAAIQITTHLTKELNKIPDDDTPKDIPTFFLEEE
ncbi:hypothetical protein FJZ33_01330 [Candidatus Poribacteria bacterium]|nr:hypothetical protein [Candidatus Poribacteria bacterium]